MPRTGFPEVVTRLDLVGDVPADAEWGIPEVLGIAGTAVHRAPGGAAHLFEALRAGPDMPSGTGRWVVAVDRARVSVGGTTSHGALAVALRLGPGPGVNITSVATHPVSPSAKVPALRLGPAPTGSGADPTPVLLLGDDDRVAAAARSVPELGYTPAVVPKSPPGTGPAPTTPYALALRAVVRPDAGAGPVSIAILGPERDVYVQATVTGPVSWSEAATPPVLPLGAPPASDDPTRLDARSEGAYVPRARYLENLPSRWRLVASRCRGCGTLTFPARGSCGRCGRADPLDAVELARSGWVVEAVTTVHPGAQPTEFDAFVAAAGAYSVVVARSPEGPRGTFQVAGPAGSVRIGDPVALILRRLYPMEGEWRYGRKATAPARNAPPA